MPSGGPRQPARPAPASGPGRLSRRTDGGPGQVQRDLPDAAYGEQRDFQGAESGAAMALAEGALSPKSGFTPGSPVPVTPFGAPTSAPGTPVTNGAPLGPGVGREALGLPSDEDVLNQDRRALAEYLPALEYIANMPSALPSLRQAVRKIKAAAGL